MSKFAIRDRVRVIGCAPPVAYYFDKEGDILEVIPGEKLPYKVHIDGYVPIHFKETELTLADKEPYD